MNKKEPMSLSEHYNLRYTLNGFVWLIYAVINQHCYKSAVYRCFNYGDHNFMHCFICKSGC